MSIGTPPNPPNDQPVPLGPPAGEDRVTADVGTTGHSGPGAEHDGPHGGIAPDCDFEPDAEETSWDDEGLFREDTTAVLGSVLFHLIVVLTLALMPVRPKVDEEAVVLVSSRPDPDDEVRLIENVVSSDEPTSEIGNQGDSSADMAAASAEMFASIAEIPNPIEVEPVDRGQIMVNKMFAQSVAPLDRLEDAKGTVGEGTQGVAGAVDRITFEILRSVEERPTLVVWMFDQSGSLHRQRGEIRDRFDRIYQELGVAAEGRLSPSSRSQGDIPILTSIIGFGSGVRLFTEEPTDDLNEIKSVLDAIEIDSSGVERPFTAVTSAVDQYRSLRRPRGTNGPQRNVMFIVVTDERGDDTDQLEPAIESCRKWGIPVHVIGVPAPFGREHALVKYVDPDPEYDQTPRWAEVDQGPESLLPERVKIDFTGNFEQEPVIDSGFGPYGLTRLCYETGGIFFTVHPNRNVSRRVNRGEIAEYASQIEYFFDPNVMAQYRPEYLAPKDYVDRVKASPLRQSLVTAAQMRPASGLSRPTTRFVKRSDAQLVGALTRAQQDAAKLTPRLDILLQTLEPGMAARDSETSPRWKAGYDLSMGRVMAQKVRTEGYNLMLAQIKRGQSFEEKENNTWVLEPSNAITVGSKWEREAETARELLQGVVRDHPDTPWALLAKKELDVPLGWKWTEEFTDLDPPAERGPGNNNNNNPRPPRDDERRMLEKRPQRPIPKL